MRTIKGNTGRRLSDILRLERLIIGEVNLIFSRVGTWMGQGCFDAPRGCQVDHNLSPASSIGLSLETLEGPLTAYLDWHPPLCPS